MAYERQNFKDGNPLSASELNHIEDGILDLEKNKLDSTKLQEAIDSALAQAKESGEFDGAPGEQGPAGPQGENGRDGVGVHIGPDAPTDGSNLWVDTDEDPEEPPAGRDGKDGKSAYQYAMEGGYTGTEEEFARKLAEENSGGGATPDWNAAEGQPGHVLNRTHYENGTETKTLLNTTVTVNNNQFAMSGVVSLNEGNSYAVTWDGITYACIGVGFEYNNSKAIALGNTGLLGIDSNVDFPFVFISSEELQGFMVVSITDGEHTIKITEEVKAYKTLDKCYLPSGLMPVVVKISSVTLVDGVPTHPHAVIHGLVQKDVGDTLWNGGRVVLDFSATELANEGFYRAEVVEWWAEDLWDNEYYLHLSYYYRGNRVVYTMAGKTWTPPTE